MNKRRVVVTGLGAVTPVGNNVEAFWESVKAGKVGIGEITKFDTADFKVKLAAEVKDFKRLHGFQVCEKNGAVFPVCSSGRKGSDDRCQN